MTRRGRAPGTDREVVRSGRGLLRLLAANQPVNEQRNQLSPPPVRGRVEQVLVGGPGGVCVDSGLRATVFMVPIVSGGVSNGHSRRVPYPMPYRQMRLLEKARNFETVRRMPLLVELMDEVNGLILKDENDTWPPKTAKHSVTPAIDVPATWILFRQGPATRS